LTHGERLPLIQGMFGFGVVVGLGARVGDELPI